MANLEEELKGEPKVLPSYITNRVYNTLPEHSFGQKVVAGIQQTDFSMDLSVKALKEFNAGTTRTNVPVEIKDVGYGLDEAFKIQPDGNKIYYGQSVVNMDYFGLNRKARSGELNMVSVNRNSEYETLNEIMDKQRRFADTKIQLTQEEMQSVPYKAASTGKQYANQLIPYVIPYIGAYVGNTYMAAQIAGGTVLDKFNKYVEEHPEDKEYTGFSMTDEEKALVAGKTIVNVALEHLFGIPARLKAGKAFLKPTKFASAKAFGKEFLKGGTEEYLTEYTQGFTDALFDRNLGLIKSDKEFYNLMKQNLTDCIYPFIFGGAIQAGSGMAYRSRAISNLENKLVASAGEDTPEIRREANQTATVMVDKMITDVSAFVSKESELNSQLFNKHGDVYNALQKSIADTLKASGSPVFQNMSEEEFGRYVAQNAKIQADTALNEAVRRGVPLQDVLNDADIVYENGELKLKKLTPEQKNAKEFLKLKQENGRTREEFLGKSVVRQPVYHTTENGDFETFDYERIQFSANGAGFNFEESKSGIYKGTTREFDIRIENPASLDKVTITREQLEKTIKEVNPKGSDNLFILEGYGNPYTDYDKTLKDTLDTIMTYAQNDAEILDNLRSNATGNVKDVFKSFVKNTGKDGFVNRERGIFVVLDDEAIKLTSNTTRGFNNNVYEQGERGITRGEYDTAKKAIKILKQANEATLPHEFAHFWLDDMWSYYDSGLASKEYMERMDALWKYLGVNPKSRMSVFGKGLAHETFASAYEKYLYQGIVPNALVAGAFNDYDKWLKRVYKDINDIKAHYRGGEYAFKMTPTIQKFFETMTTGNITGMAETAPMATIDERTEDVDNADKEAVAIVQEKKQEYNAQPTEPVQKGYSRAFEKQAKILGIDEHVEYEVKNMEEQRQLAEKFVKENPEQAKKVVYGDIEAPKGILKNAIYNAYLMQQKAIGNTYEYLTALEYQSIELTKAGQEIASQRGAVENLFDPSYWIREVEKIRKEKLASKVVGVKDIMKDPVKVLDDIISQRIRKSIPELLAAKTTKEQQKIAMDVANGLAEQFRQKGMVLKQSTLPEQITTENNAYNYIYKTINDRLGISVGEAEATRIIQRANDIEKSMNNTSDKTGNPSVLYFKNMSEMEDLANSMSPSSDLAVMTSIAGRGAMLASLKSPFTNIESNTLNTITEMIVRRMSNKVQGKAAYSAVDKNVISEYKEYAKNVYNASGYTVSSMDKLNTRKYVRGEQIISATGDNIFQKIGRVYEQTVFKYLMGYPDTISKDITFVDSASMTATDIALKEGKTGEALKQRATEIFKDIILVEPKTEEGRMAREIAVNDAMVATYTNSGAISQFALGLRNEINKFTGNSRVGDLISAFVKTPANVIALGLEYSAGSAKTLANINSIVADFKAGTLTPKTISSLAALERNIVGIALSALVASMIDDDDYIPPYALLSQKERNLVKQKNAAYNSVKIGNRYISLDYAGPLAIPLVAILQARRGATAMDKVVGFLKGIGEQTLKIPVIGDVKDVLEKYSQNVEQYTADKIVDEIKDDLVNFISSRTIPSIVSDVAKTLDPYERETFNNALLAVESKIPLLRETLEPKTNVLTGKPEERAENPVVRAIQDLLFGSRVKKSVENELIDAITDIQKNGGSVSLSKITKTGDLSMISDESKIKAEKEFAELYSEKAKQAIQRASFERKDAIDRAKVLNDIRSDIAKKLKSKYRSEIREKKILQKKSK